MAGSTVASSAPEVSIERQRVKNREAQRRHRRAIRAKLAELDALKESLSDSTSIVPASTATPLQPPPPPSPPVLLDDTIGGLLPLPDPKNSSPATHVSYTTNWTEMLHWPQSTPTEPGNQSAQFPPAPRQPSYSVSIEIHNGTEKVQRPPAPPAKSNYYSSSNPPSRITNHGAGSFSNPRSPNTNADEWPQLWHSLKFDQPNDSPFDEQELRTAEQSHSPRLQSRTSQRVTREARKQRKTSYPNSAYSPGATPPTPSMRPSPSATVPPTSGSQTGAQTQEIALCYPSPPLNIAVAHGNLACVLVLLRRDVDVEGTDALGRTPLHLCAAGVRNAIEIARLLIEYGADPMARDAAGYTPMQRAAEHGDDSIVGAFADLGMDINCA